MKEFLDVITDMYVESQGDYETYWENTHSDLLEPRIWTLHFKRTGKRVIAYNYQRGAVADCWVFDSNFAPFESIVCPRWDLPVHNIHFHLWRLNECFETLKNFTNNYIIPHLYRPPSGRMFLKLHSQLEETNGQHRTPSSPHHEHSGKHHLPSHGL